MAATPPFYDPSRVGTLFYPDLSLIAQQAEAAGLEPAADDPRQVVLLVVDMQVDFCHAQGALHVPGAADDLRRLIGFIYRNAERLTRITCSLDSHQPFQIFHPAWWVDAAGRHPAPFTVIASADVAEGRWRPVFEPDWSREYVERLDREAKKQLTIWPYHVPIGGVGNALDPELWSAVFWHAVARRSQPTWWAKGSLPGTEHYSILKPEIEVPGAHQGTPNLGFLDALENSDVLIIAGEAASHCVLETVEDLAEAFRGRPDQLAKIRILTDCTSPVRHPEIDFAAITRRRFADFESLGMRLATSADPI